MYCKECGAEIKEGKFCQNCGTKIETVNSKQESIEERKSEMNIHKLAILILIIIGFIFLILAIWVVLHAIL